MCPVTQIWRYVRMGAAILLLIGGTVLAPTPIPIGWAMIIVGLSMLVHESRWVRTRIRRLRARYPGFGEKLNQAKRYAPGFARRVIERTDPIRHQRRRARLRVRVEDSRQPPPAE